MSSSLAVVILTFNEEKHIARALNAIRDISSQVFVIDAYSTDATAQIATSLGATVIQHPFANYAQQFQWALDNAPVTADWIMRLDADEIIEPDLAAEIAQKLPGLPSDVVGINLKRKHIFMDRWVKHGGRYPLVLLRIWRKGCGKIEDRWMDEHIIVRGGRTVTFNGGFSDYNLNNLTFFTEKHNKYATREAVDVLNQKYELFPREVFSAEANSPQAAFKRFLKEGVFNQLPIWCGPLAYFLYRYFFQLGFLDGISGLIYHFLQGYWYRFLVSAKVYELDSVIKGLPNSAARKAELARLTGFRL